MSREEINDFLAKQLYGRLGVYVDGYPYIVPVNYVFKGGKIFIHSSLRGKKIRGIETNPKVCFEVDEGNLKPASKICNFSMSYRSVIAYCKAKLVRDAAEKIKALKLLVDKYDQEKKALRALENLEKVLIIELEIKSLTGRRNQ